MSKWEHLTEMNFPQFEEFIRLHGGKCWRWKDHVGDYVYDKMDGQTSFVEYRCDNINVWCRKRERELPPGYQSNGDGTFSMDW